MVSAIESGGVIGDMGGDTLGRRHLGEEARCVVTLEPVCDSPQNLSQAPYSAEDLERYIKYLGSMPGIDEQKARELIEEVSRGSLLDAMETFMGLEKHRAGREISLGVSDTGGEVNDQYS